jgi:hypothetical protein
LYVSTVYLLKNNVMNLSQINYLAVILAALTSFVVGGLWYSSLLFGKIWMKEAGISRENAKKSSMIKTFGLSFVLSLVICFNLAAFLGPESDFLWGMMAGGLAGIGWATASLGVLYLFEGRSLKLFLINGGYNAVNYIIAGGIIGAWH